MWGMTLSWLGWLRHCLHGDQAVLTPAVLLCCFLPLLVLLFMQCAPAPGFAAWQQLQAPLIAAQIRGQQQAAAATATSILQDALPCSQLPCT